MSLESYRQARAARGQSVSPDVSQRPTQTYTSGYERGYEDARQTYAFEHGFVPSQQYIEISRNTNGLGTAGFILAILSIILSFCCFFPFAIFVCAPAAALLCLLAFIFSFIGIFREPRGFAIAGFVLSLIGLIVMLIFSSAIITFLTALGRV